MPIMAGWGTKAGILFLSLLILLYLATSTALGFSLVPDTYEVDVPINGYGCTVLNASWDDAGWYSILYGVSGEDRGKVVVNLTGPVDRGDLPNPAGLTYNDSGFTSWMAEDAGSRLYYLCITTGPNASVNDEYHVSATFAGLVRAEGLPSGMNAEMTDEICSMNGVMCARTEISVAVIHGTIVPELFTAALVGAGALVVIFAVRRD